MPFVFSYNKYLDLTSQSDVAFIIQNNRGDLVYLEKVAITDPDPEYPGLYYFTDISWDGRCNKGAFAGHLADPEGSPYEAYVSLNMIAAEALRSNIETFDVVPAIDSVIVTHRPDYPPPEHYQTTTVYSIIRAKIDDSGNPNTDYKYYKPPNQGETNLNVWDNNQYYFWDLPSPPEDRQQFYYEANNMQSLNLISWDVTKYGQLDYRWLVIHDYRISTCGISYDEIIDTTEYWGDSWKAALLAPENWMYPSEFPYMRILTISEITNTKNGYGLQVKSSADGVDAHKLIFTEDTGDAGLDIVDWAISHIGVPYCINDGTTKNPYRRIECSGLVTAARIQDIGPANNQNYRIGWIEADEYYAGRYWYYNWVDLLTGDAIPIDQLTPEDGIGRGDLIHFEPLPGNNDGPHIVIISELSYKYNTGEIEECYILHARGGYTNGKGRVRYDELIREYGPIDNDESSQYRFTFIPWND